MSSSPKLWIVLMLILIFLVGVTLPATPTAHASGSFPDTSWYFHAIQYSMGENFPVLSMNENLTSSPFASTTDFGYCAFTCKDSYGFPLTPFYPYGFDIEPGTAYVDMWTLAANGTSDFQGAVAHFNFTLYSPTGVNIATTIGNVSLPPHPYASPTWNLTTIAFQVPRSYSISSSSSVSFNMTWMNHANYPTLFFEVGMNNVGQASRFRVPANYYSTSITLGINNPGNGQLEGVYLVRLGQSIQFNGAVTNLYNNTGISGVPVTISLVQFVGYPNYIQTTPLATVSTSSNGDYVYTWSPQDPALLGEHAVFVSWPGTHFFAGNVSQTAPTPPYSGPYTKIDVEQEYSLLSIQLGVPVSNPGSLVSIRGILSGLNGPISGANVVLSYQVPGSGGSTTITSAQTDSTGSYQAIWSLPATGNFTLQASWSGTSILGQYVATAFLLSVPEQGSSIWASSSSAVSSLTFSTATGRLSFTLSPPTQTGSSVTLYIPKSISGSKPNVPLTVDGTSVSYTAQETSAGWQVSFTLPNNSTSQVQVAMEPLSAMGALSPTQGNIFVIATIGGLIAAASAGVVISYWKRRPRRSTTRLSSNKSDLGPRTS